MFYHNDMRLPFSVEIHNCTTTSAFAATPVGSRQGRNRILNADGHAAGHRTLDNHSKLTRLYTSMRGLLSEFLFRSFEKRVCSPTSTHPHVDGEQRREDAAHGGLGEGVDGDDVEVPDEARRDLLATAARRAHGAQELNVLQQDLGAVLTVVPAGSSGDQNWYYRLKQPIAAACSLSRTSTMQSEQLFHIMLRHKGQLSTAMP